MCPSTVFRLHKRYVRGRGTAPHTPGARDQRRRPRAIMENPQKDGRIMTKHRIYTTSVASVYPHYVAKAEKKGRTQAEVDTIIRWLTGYSAEELAVQLANQIDFEHFFAQAPHLNPARAGIKGIGRNNASHLRG